MIRCCPERVLGGCSTKRCLSNHHHEHNTRSCNRKNWSDVFQAHWHHIFHLKVHWLCLICVCARIVPSWPSPQKIILEVSFFPQMSTMQASQLAKCDCCDQVAIKIFGSGSALLSEKMRTVIPCSKDDLSVWDSQFMTYLPSTSLTMDSKHHNSWQLGFVLGGGHGNDPKTSSNLWVKATQPILNGSPWDHIHPQWYWIYSLGQPRHGVEQLYQGSHCIEIAC